MACDWEEFFSTEKQSLCGFVEFVVYGAPLPSTKRLEKHIADIMDNGKTIEKSVTKELYVQELTLFSFLYEYFCKIDERELNARNFFLKEDEKAQKYTPSEEIDIMHDEIKELMEDSFPVPPKRYLLSYSQGFYPIYTPRELGKVLLILHNENKFTAPQSFLDYVESLSCSPQPQSQAVVPSVSVEAQLPPPSLTAPQNDVEQDDAPLCSKERIRYLKFIYGLLEINGLPTKLDSSAQRDTTAGDIQRALGEKSVSLDPKSIKKTLREIDENFARITKG